jgi:hypothetical protein
VSTRANWFIDVEIPPVDLDDPPLPLVEEVAEKIDLRDVESLQNLLHQLQAAEVRMANDGLTCAIRDDAQSTCSACPVARSFTDSDPLGSLCQNARHQERLVTSLAVHRHSLGDRAA